MPINANGDEVVRVPTNAQGRVNMMSSFHTRARCSTAHGYREVTRSTAEEFGIPQCVHCKRDEAVRDLDQHVVVLEVGEDWVRLLVRGERIRLDVGHGVGAWRGRRDPENCEPSLKTFTVPEDVWESLQGTPGEDD